MMHEESGRVMVTTKQRAKQQRPLRVVLKLGDDFIQIGVGVLTQSEARHDTAGVQHDPTPTAWRPRCS